MVLGILLGVVPGAGALGIVAGGDQAALQAVVREACGRQVVMLGESATHGDGATEAFKVAVVERLVDECGFDGVYFEASHYEFLHIAERLRQHKVVSAEEVSGAVGGLWKFDAEFQPLVPFLLEKAVAGKVSLGGIDDQLGEMGQDWANVGMVANLTEVLPEAEGKACGAAMHRRIYSEDYEGDGYSKADRVEITGCLRGVRRVYEGRPGAGNWVEMIDAIQRWVERDPLPGAQQIVARDRSMFRDFEWLQRETPRPHKVIVWTATVHGAKVGDPTWGDKTGANFGALVHQEYGAGAFTLGFSALGGRYRAGREVKEQPVAPADSLERQAMGDGDAEAVYVGAGRLKAMGVVPGAVFMHSYEALDWETYVDGVVVFREERVPGR